MTLFAVGPFACDVARGLWRNLHANRVSTAEFCIVRCEDADVRCARHTVVRA